MKTIQVKMNQAIVLVIFIFSLFSCQSPTEYKGAFKLLPHPQEFEVNGVSALNPEDIKAYYLPEGLTLPPVGQVLKNARMADDPKNADIVASLDESMDIKPEGYNLAISKRQVEITAKDRAGLLYAFMTLEQLREDAIGQQVNLPLCRVVDYPKLAFRSIHLDIKHHLDKQEYYYRLMDQLARNKVNAVIVEFEDKLGYESYPVVDSPDARSIGEWTKLSDYAHRRNIEINPLIQGLGHASFILKHEKFRGLRDDPQSDWAFNPLDPKTYEVQFGLYEDALDATPHGRYLHVGGDEVHTTGRGSDKSPLELQLIWLNKVCAFAEEHGRIPIVWDDMPLKHAGVYRPMFNTKLDQQEVDSIWAVNEHKLAEFVDRFPKNCVYMRWNYSSPQALGNKKAMEWFMENDLRVMGATAGQTRWVLMPQQESNMDNIKAFALSSIQTGLNGLLLTLWDDDSPHFELYKRGILAFAEYTWTGEKRTKAEIKSAYRQRMFSETLADSQYAFIDQLEKPVAFWKNALLNGNKRNYLQRMDDPVKEAVIDLPDKDRNGEWSSRYADRLKKAAMFAEKCDTIASRIETMKSLAVRNTYTLEVYEQVNNLTRYTLNALLALQSYDLAGNEKEEKEALQNILKLREEYEEMRAEFERVYSKTRILTKSDDYILDQDHHVHLANQTKSFDWQFYAEILFLQKIDRKFN